MQLNKFASKLINNSIYCIIAVAQIWCVVPPGGEFIVPYLNINACAMLLKHRLPLL